MKRIILSVSGGSGCGKSVLAKHLVQLLGAERAVRIPTDYYLPFVLRPVVVLDSMVPYPKADISIYDERKRRIVERDQRWKTQVIENWEQHQITLAGVLRHNPFFDLELDGMDSLAENARKILSLPALKD